MAKLDTSEGGGGGGGGAGSSAVEPETASLASSAAKGPAPMDTDINGPEASVTQPPAPNGNSKLPASSAKQEQQGLANGERSASLSEDNEHAERTQSWPNAAYEIESKVVCCSNFDNQPRVAVIVDRRCNDADGLYEYYVHYVDLDKRLDEWVSVSNLSPYDPATANTNTTGEGPILSPPGSGALDLLSPRSLSRVTRIKKRQLEETMHVQKSIDELPACDQPLEREHHEKTKIRNIQTVELGRYEMDAWYYSPFPGVPSGTGKLYMCEFCLKYMRKKKTLLRHMSKCTHLHPPGDQIYRSDGYPDAVLRNSFAAKFDPPVSMFEVDGQKNKVYCQNLCLLSKLFLDHKTLYYDVDPFLFYVMTEADSQVPGCHHVVGYFSKEKASTEDYNLACILSLPPHQRKGYGKFLIAFSYELSKKEGRTGTPERPLSDLGQVSYKSYWSRVLLDVLKEHRGDLSINDIAKMTSIKHEDIVSTLQGLNLVRYYKGQHIISVTPRVVEEHLKSYNGRQVSKMVDPSLLRWVPHPTQAAKRPR